MKWLNDICRTLDRLIDRLTDYLSAHPRVALGLIFAFLLVELIGLIRGWKWTYMDPGRYEGRLMLKYMGPNFVRFWMGVLTVVAMIAVVFLAVYAEKQQN